jgi:hypothetical protein
MEGDLLGSIFADAVRVLMIFDTSLVGLPMFL